MTDGGRFATTRWSLVLAAGADAASTDARTALATLCETYWYPLYAFLRSRGYKAEDAQDLTQAFFARVLEKHAINRADPARGRFRSFLLASLKNFAANEHERVMAQRRGGGVSIVSLELEGAEGRFEMEPPTDETPERIFDRRWALTLLARVMSRLEEETTEPGKRAQFEALSIYLTGDLPNAVTPRWVRIWECPRERSKWRCIACGDSFETSCATRSHRPWNRPTRSKTNSGICGRPSADSRPTAQRNA